MRVTTICSICSLILFIQTCRSIRLRRKNAEVTYPPTFTVTPSTLVYAKPDEPLILPCHVDAMPAPNYQWLVDGKEADWIKPYYHVTSISSTSGAESDWDSSADLYGQLKSVRGNGGDGSGTTMIQEPTRWYLGQIGLTVEFKPGVYQCTAWNIYGRVISSPVQVRFARLGTIQDVREQNITVRSDDPIRLNCSVTSSEPAATVRWMSRAEDGSVEFIRENRTRATDDQGNLYLLDAHTGQNLVFVCAVNNPVLRTIKTGPDVHVRTVQLDRTGLWTGRHGPRLLYHSMQQQIALVNHSLVIKCIVAGNPLPSLLWQWSQIDDSKSPQAWTLDEKAFRDVEQLPKTLGVSVRHDGTQLVIHSAKSINAGTYRCVAKVSRGTERPNLIPMFDFKVKIEGEPAFAHRPQNTIVPVMGTAVIQCAVDEDTTRPPAQVTWLLNGGPIDSYLDGHRKLRRFDDLYIHNATVDDIAVFQCQIGNVHGWRVANAYLHVWQQPPAIVRSLPDEQFAVENGHVILPCRTIGAPTASVQWLRNGILLAQTSQWTRELEPKYQVTLEGDLRIESVAVSDTGQYSCIASNQWGDSRATGRLSVRKPTRIVAGPRLVLGPGERSEVPTPSNRNNAAASKTMMESVMENTSVWLNCDVSADPMEMNHLRMAWKRNGEPIGVDLLKPEGRISLSADASALHIAAVKLSDTGTYTCLVWSRLDSDNSSVQLIVQGKPAAPRQLTLTCSEAGVLSPFARLNWQLGPYNNPPVDHAIIEYVAGTYRPLAPSLDQYHHGADVSQSAGSFSNNGTDKAQSLQAQWVRETLSKSRQLAKKLILTNRWSRMHPVTPSVVGNYLVGQQLIGSDAVAAMVTHEPPIENAYVRLYADVVYHFRVRLVNRIGQSEPSLIVPELDGQTVCHLPPQPVMAVPDELLVYGTHPHNLRIRWPPLPPIEHNGPGLIYKLTITCLDCQLGPSKPLANVTVVSDWSVGELELEQLTTRELIGREKYERIRHWQIETYRTYEVNLTTENLFGTAIGSPAIVRTGHSGEGVPVAKVDPGPQVLSVGAQNATLSWRELTAVELDRKIHGFFRGFRVEWCEAKLTEDLCNFYKVHQDYVVQKPPSWTVPQLRTSAAIKHDSGKANDEKELKFNDTNDELATDSISSRSSGGLLSDTGQKLGETDGLITLVNRTYIARLTGLPGKTRIKAWLRVLNIQFSGPKSNPVYFDTEEGVPEPVPEIVATFVGVTHVELSWVKPLKTNGDLIAYDLEVTQASVDDQNRPLDPNHQVKARKSSSEPIADSNRSGDGLVKRKTIADPEQLATRISGLRMDTEYCVTIWPRTNAGRGGPAELRIRTAQLTRHSDITPFLVSTVPNSPNSVNVCLSGSLNFPVSATLAPPFTRSIEGHRGATEPVSDGLPPTGVAVLDVHDAHIGPWQNEQVSTSWSANPSVSASGDAAMGAGQSKSGIESDMFYAQFRTVGDEFWEETQREFQKPWIVLSNLIPNQEYEIRVVIVKASGLSTVSQSKTIRVPTPPESWFTNPGFFTRFTSFQNSTVLIGSICALIMLLSSIVAAVFLARWCRHRSSSAGHRPPVESRIYDALKDHRRASRATAQHLLDATCTPIVTNLNSNGEVNIPDANKVDLNQCVWIDRAVDPCTFDLSHYAQDRSDPLTQLMPELSRSLTIKASEDLGLLTYSSIPLTDFQHPSVNGESTYPAFTHRTFRL